MGARFRVSIDDRQAARLPVKIDCDSVVALMEMNGQAAFSTRGISADNLALHAATMLVRLHEFDPAVMAAAVVLIRHGRIGTAGAGRRADTGESLDIAVRNPKEVAREVIQTLRIALDMKMTEGAA